MTQTVCHPERSLAVSAANRQTQSKDPMFADTGNGTDRTFRIAIRFFDEHKLEYHQGPSREAAKECSPRLKPWGNEAMVSQPRRGDGNDG